MEAHTWSEAHADLPRIAQANASAAVARQFLKRRNERYGMCEPKRESRKKKNGVP
jgi:hypothetical protein